MKHIDFERNPALFERAVKEVSHVIWRRLRGFKAIHIRTEAIKKMAEALDQTSLLHSAVRMPQAPDSPWFGGGRLDAGFERSIQEGNASMNRMHRGRRRTYLVEILAAQTKISWSTAEQIVDQCILAG